MLCRPSFVCRGSSKDVDEQTGTVTTRDGPVRRDEPVGSAPPKPPSRLSSLRASSMTRDGSAIFHDAIEGDDADWQGISRKESVFFDTMEHVSMYPPIITSMCPRASAISITMDEPETLLRSPRSDEEESLLVLSASRLTSEHSKRVEAGQFRRARRSTRAIRRELEKPGVIVQESGFPGQLTPHELEQVQLFREELNERDPVYREIVHSLEPVEEEPYALCRFLRARKFVPKDVFALIDEAKDLWREARENDFYPSKAEALGVQPNLFATQYPFMYYGNAKNGCPVAYFNCGQIQSEGVLCLSTFESVPKYFWHESMYTLKDKLAAGRDANPNFVRCETVQVYDMKGLTRSTINSDAIEVVKIAAEITKCFPETLHCLIILNAPSYFKMAWSLIKKFIDARTASRIEVYSNTKQGTKRVLEMIDANQVPSDLGGTAPPTSEIIEMNADGSAGVSQKVELMYIKKGSKETKYEFQVQAGQQLSSAKVYTRSATGGTFKLYKNDKLIKEVEVAPENGNRGDAAKPYTAPYCTEIASNIQGPGKFRVGGSSTVAPGYFLFVAEIPKSK